MTAMLRLDHALPERRRLLFVDWMIGNACNYACHYCPPSLHDGSQRWIPAETIVKFSSHLAALASERGQEVVLQMAGGEVTTIPGFIRMLAALREQHVRPLIISNATRESEWWERAAEYLDEVVLTYHPERASLEHFTDVARTVGQRITTHVNVAAPPDYFEVSLAAARHLAANCTDITIRLKPMLLGFGEQLYPYGENQLRMLREERFETAMTRPRSAARAEMLAWFEDGSNHVFDAGHLLAAGLNRWKGWSCDIGIELLCIRHSGEIFRGECGVGGQIGHLRQGREFRLPADGVLCTRNSCSCLLDIMSSRRANASPALAGGAA